MLNEKVKDFIAGLIALVFVVTAGYLALNRFNNPTESPLGQGGSEVADTMDATENTSEREDNAMVAGDNSMMSGDQTTMSYWQPNDYSTGDIATGEYTVASGDTLWEIAEATYGDGSMWTKILDANPGSVGYLPNGSQAMIYAGQTLVIPN